MTGAAHVVGIFPHPDDEALAAGGTLALCARAGAKVTVVCLTRGEAGSARNLRLATSEEVAALRSAELDAACDALGLRSPVHLEMQDGALARVHEASAAGRIADLLRREEADAVITVGWDGIYGHEDHIACTRLVGRAVDELPAEPRVLHAAFPRGLFGPVWRRLKRHRSVRIVEEIELGDLGIERDEADLCVDVTSVRDLKLAAVAAHASQLADGDPTSFVFPGLLEPLLEEEWFTLSRGAALPDGATDPLAGL